MWGPLWRSEVMMVAVVVDKAEKNVMVVAVVNGAVVLPELWWQ